MKAREKNYFILGYNFIYKETIFQYIYTSLNKFSILLQDQCIHFTHKEQIYMSEIKTNNIKKRRIREFL